MGTVKKNASPNGIKSVAEQADEKQPRQGELSWAGWIQQLIYELHDALAQTLFSASLIADVLPRLWERDPQEGLTRLDELRQLTRVALAEVHSLFDVLGLPSDRPEEEHL